MSATLVFLFFEFRVPSRFDAMRLLASISDAVFERGRYKRYLRIRVRILVRAYVVYLNFGPGTILSTPIDAHY